MQSDTVIGIVGAVVLVAVMVGVFAYEYNNAPEPDTGLDPDSTEGKMAAFNATFPSLDGMENIDGDAEPNYNDTDVDGDGIENSEDNETSFSGTYEGSVAQKTPASNPEPQDTFTVFVGTGSVGGTVTVTWTTTEGIAGPIDNLDVSISGVQCTNGDGTATCDLAGAEPGEYTVVVRHAQPAAQAKSFDATFHVDY